MNKKFVQKFKYENSESQNSRLDFFVSNILKITRSQAQKLIKDGLVLVNNVLEKTKYELTEKDEIEIFELEPVKKSKVKIPVIYEDKDIIVVDKPSGVSTHIAPGEKDLTVVDYFRKKLSDFSLEDERAGVVHRLDKGTSGLLILAKNQNSLNKLQKEFKNRHIRKTYVALVEGIVEPSAGIINMPIARDQNKREKMAVSKTGKDAVTEFSTLVRYKNRYTLLKLNPKTGRTHQIRVHLSSLGYPIVGDLKYSNKSNLTNRIFLHAEKIEFKHPTSDKNMSFEVELPTELKDVLKRI